MVTNGTAGICRELDQTLVKIESFAQCFGCNLCKPTSGKGFCETMSRFCPIYAKL